MTDTPAIVARAQKKQTQRMRGGKILSFTTVAHAPAGFPSHPRYIGLIEHDDGSKSLGVLRISEGVTAEIGQHVRPRMQYMRTNEQGLRVYDIAYEIIPAKPVRPAQEFPGYIIALTGPIGVGKSTISSMLGKVAGDFVTPIRLPMRKRTTTLRSAEIESVWREGKIPVVIADIESLEALARHYGRRSILSFGLLPPGKSKRTMLSHLLHRLRVLGRDSEKTIQGLLKVAEKDLSLLKERADLLDHVLVNEDTDQVLSLLRGHILKIRGA